MTTSSHPNGRTAAHGFSLMEIIVVVAVIGVISAIASPMFNNAIQSFRVSGDARGVSNAAAVAKMRAASEFSRVRLYADLSANTYRVQTFDKTSDVCCWVDQGGATGLSAGVAFGFGAATLPPPNTQAAIGQAQPCLDDMGDPIANSACIMFNSRGVPIDATFAPTGTDALYVTDGASLYGVTIAATGMLRMWYALPAALPVWTAR